MHRKQTIPQLSRTSDFTVAEYINHLNGTSDCPRIGDDDDYNIYSREWTCPIDDCDASFRTLNVLDQHLGSPHHDVNAFKCPNTDCVARFSCLSGLLQHVENAKSCSEDVNRGTGCLGRLWLILLEKFNMLPRDRSVDLLKGEARQQMHRVGYAQVLSC